MFKLSGEAFTESEMHIYSDIYVTRKPWLGYITPIHTISGFEDKVLTVLISGLHHWLATRKREANILKVR